MKARKDGRPRKVRIDAPVKQLALKDPATGDKIFAWCVEDGLEAAKGRCLAELSLTTSANGLSEFFAWWPVASQLREAADFASNVKGLLREMPDLDLNEEQVSRAGQAIFETQAIAAKDSKAFVALRSLRQTDKALELKSRGDTKKAEQKDRDLTLAERRVAVLEAKEAKAIAVVNDKTLTPTDQAARIREIFKK